MFKRKCKNSISFLEYNWEFSFLGTQITHPLLYDTQTFRGVATNRGPGDPGSNWNLVYIVSTNVIWKRLMLLHRVNNIQHNIKQNIHDTVYKNSYLKNDASSKKTNFQMYLFFKEHSWRRRFSNSFSMLSITVSVISYSHIWNRIRKSVWQQIRRKVLK